MLHELFLFIGGTTCYASCLATVGVGGVIGGPAILTMLGFTSSEYFCIFTVNRCNWSIVDLIWLCI